MKFWLTSKNVMSFYSISIDFNPFVIDKVPEMNQGVEPVDSMFKKTDQERKSRLRKH